MMHRKRGRPRKYPIGDSIEVRIRHMPVALFEELYVFAKLNGWTMGEATNRILLSYLLPQAPVENGSAPTEQPPAPFPFVAAVWTPAWGNPRRELDVRSPVPDQIQRAMEERSD